MGATASRSSPAAKATGIITVPVAKYFERTTIDTIDFCGNLWHLDVHPMGHILSLALTCVDKQEPWWTSDTDVSIEILDETGQHTMFHEEDGRMVVNMREIEASSCVNGDGALTVRWTLSFYADREFAGFPLGNLSTSKVEPVDLEPAMVGHCTFTTNSFSKLKATLRRSECAYSKPFSAGGIKWYFKIYPNGHRPDEDRMSVLLVREDDLQEATTAEFNFEFEGVANYESGKMTHMFHCTNNEAEYKLPPLNTDAKHDPLIIRCCLTVIAMETPSFLYSML